MLVPAKLCCSCIPRRLEVAPTKWIAMQPGKVQDDVCTLLHRRSCPKAP